MSRDTDNPSPLVGEGGAVRRTVTGEGAAASRLTTYARDMRKDPTDAERKLWYALRDRRLCKLKFRRQFPMGNYIADFICHDPKLIVEVDGSQHADSAYDEKRDTWLKAQGFGVLRVWNGDVLSNIEGVLETILDAAFPSSDPVLADRPTFSHRGRRERACGDGRGVTLPKGTKR